MKRTYILVFQILFGLSTHEQIIFDDTGLGLLSLHQAETAYDIDNLVNQLNLQLCSIVEVGEGICSMFVEFRTDFKSSAVKSEDVAEVFLGLCPCSTLKNWHYCTNHLYRERPDDCQFIENTASTSARVHRRLCDITSMPHWNAPCNCSQEFAGQYLYPVNGFGTCYRAPLPNSICSPRSVCGIASCYTKTLNGVHMVKCDEKCHGKNKHITTKFRTINSVWTPWSKNTCNNVTKRLESESICLDSKTNSPAFDCLGPGVYCCPITFPECRCFTTISNDVLKVKRILTTCENKPFKISMIGSELNNSVPDKNVKNYMNLSAYNPNTREFFKRAVDIKDYSSHWDSPQEYFAKDIPKKDRLGNNSLIQKQHNWDDLEPKNADPWADILTPDGLHSINISVHNRQESYIEDHKDSPLMKDTNIQIPISIMETLNNSFPNPPIIQKNYIFNDDQRTPVSLIFRHNNTKELLNDKETGSAKKIYTSAPSVLYENNQSATAMVKKKLTNMTKGTFGIHKTTTITNMNKIFLDDYKDIIQKLIENLTDLKNAVTKPVAKSNTFNFKKIGNYMISTDKPKNYTPTTIEITSFPNIHIIEIDPFNINKFCKKIKKNGSTNLNSPDSMTTDVNLNKFIQDYKDLLGNMTIDLKNGSERYAFFLPKLLSSQNSNSNNSQHSNNNNISMSHKKKITINLF
ncbi:uncharacterized protein LOC142326907 [Lycorma delicatula]|uniref:uncharacterized protein LOC142326907 n=1 Tax=Lycorma delicatula TaxID=130591 RepID=UPI003F5169F3